MESRTVGYLPGPARLARSGAMQNTVLSVAQGEHMKEFVTRLEGKTVMTEEGQLLGVLVDFLVETRTGRIESMLVDPAASVDLRQFRTDPHGRLVLSVRAMRSVRDVIIARMRPA